MSMRKEDNSNNSSGRNCIIRRLQEGSIVGVEEGVSTSSRLWPR